MDFRTNLDQKYPNIAWMIEDGTVEITSEYERGIVIRAIDEGGVIWEGEKYKSLESAMDALEKGIGKWYGENMKRLI
jgi:hypothetical protein